MICPKYKAALLVNPRGFERIREGDAECDGQECAQWVKDGTLGECAIKVLALNSENITGALEQIVSQGERRI